MRLDARDTTCPRGVFLDVATGQPIRWIIWADLPDDPECLAEFEAFREEPRTALRRGILPGLLRYKGKARLRFIPAAPVYGRKASTPRDLAGSLEEARRRVEPKLLIPGEECDVPGCHRLAGWRVSDEQEIEPETDAAGKRFERAIVIRVRSYCDRHWKEPTFTNIRGVQAAVAIEEVRSQ